ncbi:MAG: hypothetical protein JWN21_2637 [Sphingomonas bacterium]|nr:hypothetical protein [Sphingomonas bacterium]
MTRTCLLGASLLALAAAAPAQIIPVPLDNSSIATPTPTPAPTAAATPAPTPTPTPLPTARPTPTPTPVPTATPTPTRTSPVAPTPAPSPTSTAAAPVDEPTPEATPTAVPVPAATVAPAPIETVVLPQERREAPLWPWLLGAGLLGGLAWVLLRRRFEPAVEEEVALDPEPEPPVAPEPVPAAPAPAFFERGAPASATLAGRARLTVDVRPTRAGLNLLTATVEAEITVTNTGDGPAADIRAAVALLSAGGEHAAALAQFNAAPVTRPVAPPFTLAPGAQHRFRAVAALPHAQIQPLEAAGRPIFVPLVAVTLRHRDGAGDHRTSQGWGVGVVRADSPKLAPFWLDVPPRNYEAVAARAQGPVREE